MTEQAIKTPPRAEVLTVEEAAAELGVSEAVVYAAVKDGYIPKLPFRGRLIRIPAPKFEQYKRGELDEQGEPQRQPTERQKDLLKGVKPIIQRR